ncbi:BON domain-containing protein [Neoehrlichia mikurensis]|uniref:BON domain-containing protein n=1 Tax=Neoehrlichia mikurensis TaxID=89586 RepID=A0A9Q9BV89_9RICK|nr:BON domain-containing protein [Neoehrlichia mikurensis]QXK91741.1 BON domain-containing protein [Neoehrlichia mikurensis]QXK92953.1 BON domain-containing protein [Neoehrlichia mikurensis]QXK93431.1 BON domain-containing protein [Neoehrlichia mikurensis]UTO55616.1 BON domain-containing protein [Neoehrlichia mikurensis]UTO56537.1 BON domain-containing protein [Neoehrlichia mikurensis]
MRIISLILTVFLMISQTSCTAILAGLAVTTGAIVTLQDRSVGDTIDDTAILIKINKGLFKIGVFSSVTVKVNEGRVLLLGNVKSLEKRISAEKIAWQQKDVREVVNEISVEKNVSNLKELTIDSIISTQVKARIIGSKGVKSMNYSVSTINGIVYLMGISQDKKELDTVVSAARRVKGVKQVVSYVRFKDSKLRH